jgi:PAS domain-containing protein
VIADAPVLMFALDRDGAITFHDGAALVTLREKAAAREMVGRSALEVWKDHPEIVRNIRRALAGEAFTTIIEMHGLFFETRYTPLWDPATREVSGVIGVATDISERKRAENALHASHEASQGAFIRAARQRSAVPFARRKPAGQHVSQGPARALHLCQHPRFARRSGFRSSRSGARPTGFVCARVGPQVPAR